MKKKQQRTNFHAVIDVEALVFSDPTIRPVLEQVGFCIVDENLTIVSTGKLMVLQPMDASQISAHLSAPMRDVQQAIFNYSKVTGDWYIHTDTTTCVTEKTARDLVVSNVKIMKCKVYAKNKRLEEVFFGAALDIIDLELYSCPKYPCYIHDPRKECIFFSKYIPVLDANAPPFVPMCKEKKKTFIF